MTHVTRLTKKRNTTTMATHALQPIPQYATSDTVRIAIVQPGCFGDNINSTLMLQPLKSHLNCTIDVFTTTTYASAFLNNDLIDNLIQFSSTSKNDALHHMITIPPLLSGCGYTHIFNPHPMQHPDKWTSVRHGELGTNLICAWVRALEEYDVPTTGKFQTILRLTSAEVENVNRFVAKIPHFGNHKRNLMEMHGESGQTFWDHRWTVAVTEKLCGQGQMMFASRRETGDDFKYLKSKFPNLFYQVSELTIRECAELFNRCQRFFSVSSGLSNAVNTNWCKTDIEWIETINSEVVSSAPIRRDGKVFWMDNNLDNFLKQLS